MAAAATTTNFQAEVLDSQVPVLVDFWAPWCGPCRAIGPAVEELASKFASTGTAKVMKLDVDEESDIASRYGVMSIPALLVFKGGKVVDMHVGALPKEKMEELVTRNL